MSLPRAPAEHSRAEDHVTVHYLAISRQHRPPSFSEVIGQQSAVTALRNALRFSRISHAYLFSGTRGCGKTTLARIFAKALNCVERSPEGDPCNRCSSCRQIDQHCSLDVVEIDGASHRGIDDIRQLRESAEYSASGGAFKVYIVDEVHMLTKEAFNALLKTLEEPPPQVKFLFATTEPHRVPLTVLSRCQHFALNLVETEAIAGKLRKILEKNALPFEEPAVHLIARRAEGSVRDAESMLDQVLCFSTDKLQLERAQQILGVVDANWFFQLDDCAKSSASSRAFQLTETLLSQGLDLVSAAQQLLEHYRHHLVIQLHRSRGGLEKNPLHLTSDLVADYLQRSAFYTQDQCLHILDLIKQHQQLIRAGGPTRIYFEMLLVAIARSKEHLSNAAIWQKLEQVEDLLLRADTCPPPLPPPTSGEGAAAGTIREADARSPERPSGAPPGQSSSAPLAKTEPDIDNLQVAAAKSSSESNPLADLSKTHSQSASVPPHHLSDSKERQARFDTLVQFAAVEFSAQIEVRSQSVDRESRGL